MMRRALLFPGQGAQSVGMGRDLAENIPACRALFDRAGDVLGYDLASICFQGPEDALQASDRAQPAIFTVSIAAWTALRERHADWTFVAAAGHSLGEWSALHAAGAISFDDALRVLKARGEFIQAACEAEPGGMLAVIGLDRPALQTICEETGVTCANLNSPEQTVLSGRQEALDVAEVRCKEAGAKRAVRLAVAGAFHSPLMGPAAERMREVLDGVDLCEPAFPVLSNYTGRPHEGVEELRNNMVAQITGSVRWVDCMQWMAAHGVQEAVECGPGKVLSGLMKRIDKSISVTTIGAASDVE